MHELILSLSWKMKAGRRNSKDVLFDALLKIEKLELLQFENKMSGRDI